MEVGEGEWWGRLQMCGFAPVSLVSALHFFAGVDVEGVTIGAEVWKMHQANCAPYVKI